MKPIEAETGDRMQSFQALFQRFGFCLLLLLLLRPFPALGSENKPRIALFIPEYSAFWSRLAEFTRAAADDLEVDLQILAAGPPRGEVQRQNMLRQVEQVLQQGVDGILFANFQGIGEDILRRSQAAGVPALLINTALDDRSLQPRSKYPLWIGSILPDDRETGLRLATSLIEAASRKGAATYRIFAFTGYPDERSHRQRLEALRNLADARSDVELTVVQQNTRDGDQAGEQFLAALRQHPDINILWSYKDPLALQAGKALHETPPPGVDPRRIAIGGIDWNPPALKGIRDGLLDLDIGGHVLDGALGLVLLSDYINGYDFAEQGLHFPSMMSIARAGNIDPLITLFENPGAIDFRRLSRRFNPQRKQYRFDLDNLLNSQKNTQLQLTPQQRDWLEKHPTILIGAMNDWPPFDFVDDQGKPAGIGADLVKALNRLLGGRLKLVSGNWKNLYERTRKGEIDALLDLTPKPSRDKDFLFTRLYQDVPHVIIARKDSTFLDNEQALKGRKLALEEGFGNVEYFRRNHPSVRIKRYPDTLAALEAVSRGDADAYAGNRAVALYLIDREDLTNLRVHGRLAKGGSRLAIGVRHDAPMLRDILDRALAQIGEERIRQIARGWLYGARDDYLAPPPAIGLSEQEKAWLRDHPRIRLAVDINWTPMEFIDDKGRYSGLSSEFIHYFERQLGIRFEPPPRLPWSQVIAGLKKRELDLAPMVLRTAERQKFLAFTRPYLNFPVVVFTRNDGGVLGGMEELMGRRVGVVRDYAIAELLRRDYPGLRLIEFDDNESGFNALALGRIDAFVDLLATGAYLIADKGLSNIQVAALTPYDHGFSMGVRKDWPELVSILDKAIAALPPEQKNAFVHKWLNVQFQQKVDYRLVTWIVIIALIVVLLFAFRAWEMSRVNRKLQESQRRLALSLRGARLGTWELHHQPDGQQWMDWDRNFAEHHGLGAAAHHQPLSLIFERMDEEEQISHGRAALQACIEGRREAIRFEYSCDHGRRWVSIEGQVFERGSQGLRLVGISQDITDRIEASRALQQSSEFKSQFLANMSHEIRTPMNAIVGLGHLLSRTPLNAQQKGYVHNLQSSAQSLLTLVNDILDFSKIEAGHLDIDHIEFDLEELLADLARLNALRIGDKPVEFLYDIQPDVPVNLMGDPFRVNQVLTNLVSNAIKFTEQGSIILRVTRTAGGPGQARLRFEVRDTGIGIEAEQLEQLFEAFVQADGSTTRRFGGTGLGLSISKQLVELMGGEIHADSEPGKGSRFWFELPFDLADERCARYLPANGNLDLRGLRVLLVDDNDTALQILGSMLQAMSFEVTAVPSGERALAELQRNRFDLVLLDWRMPQMSGDRLSAEIRRLVPRRQLPIIIMITAYGREADEQALDMRQLDGFLVKPITPSQLFNAIIMARHAIADDSMPQITVESAAEPARPPLRGRVMLAEDNPINQQVAQELLEQMGLEVVICDNGREVLERIDEARPDLVLMDIQMPELDGHETTLRLRQNPRWRDLPILAMTANAMADDVRKALQNGMNAHIAKPVNPDLLYRMLSQFLPVEEPSPAETGAASAGGADDWPDQVPGIDIRRGIAQVGGNASLYRKLLRDFLRTHGDSAMELERHLEENDTQRAERLLHTLKGVAANVGAARLAEAAARLDESLRKGEPPPQNELTEFRQALEEVRDSLQQLDTAAPDPQPATRSSGTSDIEQLRQALGDGDSRSAALFHELREALCTEWGEEDCRQLQQLIEDHEFDTALRWLEKR